MIQVQDLVKWYGPVLAVDHLSFSFPAGQVIGFLGPNGAGKSTTLRILTGYLPATSGTALIDGVNVTTHSAEARRRIGYLPESTPLYPEMRVSEYLHYRGQLYGMDRKLRAQRISEACDKCGLSQVSNRLIGQLSKGNRQRVGLAQALIHDPSVLILDEPTAGLDPNQIAHFRDLLTALKGRHTIILSTHILPEVEKTADQVLIIAKGRIVAEGTPSQLRTKVTQSSRVVIEARAGAQEVRQKVGNAKIGAAIETVDAGEGWTRALVTPQDKQDIREPLAQLAQSAGWLVREIGYENASLEQFFVQVTAQQSQTAA
jgi:ABC-2 type transport system ATP-binding protein